MPYVADVVFDSGLDVLATATALHVCSQQPASFADVGTYSLGNNSSPAVPLATDRVKGGREVIVPETAVPTSVAGTATHWALVTADTLLASAPVVSTAVASGETFMVGTFTIGLPDPTTGLAEYAHLTTETADAAMIVRAEFDNRWTGSPDYATDAEYTAAGGTVQTSTSNANLAVMISNLDVTKHHKIYLSATGDWTETAGDLSINGKDFKASGGSVLITSENPANPITLREWVRITGSTHIHFRAINFGRSVTDDGSDPLWTPAKAADPGDPLYNTPDPRNNNNQVYITRSTTFPAWPVVMFEDCGIGTLFGTPGAPPTEFIVGLRLDSVQELQVIGCTFKGCWNGISTVRTRRVLSHRNDFQQIISDNEVNLINTLTDTLAGFLTDPYTYYWCRLNVYRNPVDANDYLNPDGSDPEFYQTHSDVFQNGTGADEYGYRSLMEFCVAYRTRTTYTDVDVAGSMVRRDGGIQGAYMDDTPHDINLCLHSNIIVGSGYNMATGWTGDFHVERNTLGRPGALAPSATVAVEGYDFEIDYHPRFWSRKDDLAGAVATHRIINNVYAELSTTPTTGMAAADTIIDQGNLIADPRKTAAPGTTYAEVLSGTFTTDSEGRVSYSFTDDGAADLPSFRAAVYNVFALQSGAAKGTPNPATWPTE